MYNDYFGLSDTPFSIAPNPQYLYMSERHREALAHLLYGIQSDGGFLLLSGEVGTGKTTVCRCLLEQVPEDIDTAYILNPKLTAIEMLATICDDLHISYESDGSIKILVDALNRFLLDSHQQARRTVVIIDEAQNLSVDVLEQLRLLTNLETNQRKLLQIVLLGQPELLTLLAKPELRQLSQRVTARFHLDALTQQEVGEYIQHRLEVAGSKGTLFPLASIKQIYKITNGIPRLINLVCDRSLLGTYVQNRLQVNKQTINKAAEEILGPQKNDSNILRNSALAAGFALLASTGYLYFSMQPKPDEPRNVQTTENSPVTLPSRIQLNAPTKVDASAPVENRVTSYIEPLNDSMLTRIEIGKPSAESIDNLFSRDEGSPLNNLTGFTEEVKAFTALFKLWGHDVIFPPGTNACEIADNFGLECFSKLGSLRELRHLDRPVIIDLPDSNGTSAYYLLTSITDDALNLLGLSLIHI